MITDAVAAGKVFQRVHVVTEPLTDYLRYELGWSYPPNVEAGEDIRILSRAESGPLASLPRCTTTGCSTPATCGSWNTPMTARSDAIEQITIPRTIVRHAYWRDAALHHAIPYRDYMRRAELLAAS